MRARNATPPARIGWCWSSTESWGSAGKLRVIILRFKRAQERGSSPTWLLKDALLRIASAADIVGARAVLVHAIDETAKQFYLHFDFEPSPVHEFQLMLLMKDLRRALGTRDAV